MGIDPRRRERFHELGRHGWPRHTVCAMRGQLWVGCQAHARRTELEVEPGVLGRSRHDRETLHPECLQLAFRGAELHELPPAEWAPETDQQGEEHWAAAAIVRQGHGLVPIDGRQREIGCGFAGLDRRPRVRRRHRRLLLSIGTGAPSAHRARARPARTPAAPSRGTLRRAPDCRCRGAR